MSQQIVEIVERVLAKAPAWIRQDLQASDPLVRARAEEALAVMIGAALQEQNRPAATSSSVPAG